MIAANIMSTELLTLGPNDTMLDAMRLSGEKNIRQIPVVDGSMRVLGVVRPRSILKALLPGYISNGLLEDVRFAPELPEFMKNIGALASRGVASVMEAEFSSVTPEAHTMELAAIFTSSRRTAESILVVDDQKRLLGIISPGDLFKRLCEYADRKI